MRRFISSRWLGISIVALGLAMMGYGIYRNELSIIFAKATKICLECIGIG